MNYEKRMENIGQSTTANPVSDLSAREIQGNADVGELQSLFAALRAAVFAGAIAFTTDEHNEVLIYMLLITGHSNKHFVFCALCGRDI